MTAFLKDCQRLPEVAVEQVDIGCERESGRVVAEPALDLNGVAAFREQDRGASAVATERGAALSATNAGAKLPNTSGSQTWETALKTWDAQKTYLVTLYGEFTGNVSIPAGDTAPKGSVLTLILDAYTGKITMMGLNKTQPSLNMSSLGAVEEL